MTYFDPPRMQLATHSLAGGVGTFSAPESCFIAQALSLISPIQLCSAAPSGTNDSMETAKVVARNRESIVMKKTPCSWVDRGHDVPTGVVAPGARIHECGVGAQAFARQEVGKVF